VDECVALLHQQGHDVDFLYGSYPPGGAATAAGAFTSAYREHLGDDEAAVRAALPHTPLLVPAFAALLRGDVAPAGSEPLTKVSLQTVFVHATRSFARARTTIVLIDDLHFAPDEGRALFASLALAVPGHRILLVGTARREIDAAWVAQVGRGVHVSRVRLPRLGAKDLVLLLRDSLRSERLAEELAAKIAVKSDGNPFFVFEILRGLRDGQFITRKPDGTWATTKVIAEIEVPDTVKDLIFARVGSLATEERNLLDVASCAGFEFDPVLVGEVLHVGRIPVLQRLAAVETSHRLVRSVGRRFVFDHHQVAEVLYAGLPEILREEYHGSIADAMERRTGAVDREPRDLGGALCVDLAEHFLKGAQGPRAMRYLDAALEHLDKGYRMDAGVRLAERALAVPGLLEGRTRCDALLRTAARLDHLARRDAARRTLEEAVALADADGDGALRARARNSLGWLFCEVSRNDEAAAALGEARALARAAGDLRGEAAATGNLGNVYWSIGRLAEARELQERHLVLAREIGDRRGEATATGNLGIVLARLGRNEEAREHFERSRAIARETGDRPGEANATGNLGSILRVMRRFEESQDANECCLTLSREVGDRRSEANATGNLGNVFLSLGRLGEALEHFERHLALSGETGDRMGEVRAAGCLGNVLLSLGRFAESRERNQQYLALSREIGDRRSEGFALQCLGNLSAEEGDADAAERRYGDALALRRQIGHRVGEADSLRARGSLLASQGRESEASADLGAALALARELSLPGEELLATAWRARLPGGDVAAALSALAALEGRADARETMEARFVLWQATRDPAHLAEAKRRLDFLVGHAPPGCRGSMISCVNSHREIAEAAARELGVP
jgi:tetratricopeptide (TPR) repeat protein